MYVYKMYNVYVAVCVSDTTFYRKLRSSLTRMFDICKTNIVITCLLMTTK